MKYSIFPVSLALFLMNIRPIVGQPPGTPLTKPRGSFLETRYRQVNVGKQERSIIAQKLGSYTLGGGDNIRVDIYDVPQLSGEYQIPAGGAIQLPLIGTISLQGLTLEEAAQKISVAYSNIIKRPSVTVSLQATRPLNIWISGEVGRPGSYLIPLAIGGGSRPSVQFPTLMQAIEKAGGIRQTGDILRIQVRRLQKDSRASVLTFNLQSYLKNGNIDQDITLRDGDEIFVPSSANLTLTELDELSESSFAFSSDLPRNIFISGEVYRPGSYVVIGGNTNNEARTIGRPSVTRALQLAGGIKNTADLRRVTLIRSTRSGSKQIIYINLWDLLQKSDGTQDTILQDRDQIIVPKANNLIASEISEITSSNFAPATIKINVVGEVTRPGTLDVSPKITLNQAILAAGGFNELRANRSTVELIRFNANGTVDRRSIQVNLNQGVNKETNPLILANDVIIVKRSNLTQAADQLGVILNPINALTGSIILPTRIIELMNIFKSSFQ